MIKDEERCALFIQLKTAAWRGGGGDKGECSYERGEFKGSRKRESGGVIVCMRRIWDMHL